MAVRSKDKAKKQRPYDYWDRVFAGIALVIIAAAWIVGGILQRQEAPECQLSVFEEATECRPIGNDMYEAVRVEENGTETVVGWGSFGEATGYGGPLQVFVGVKPDGQLAGVKVIKNKETQTYFRRLEQDAFFEQFQGMAANASFQLDADVDAVTRATVSSQAVADAAQEASYRVAERQLDMAVTREVEPIKFGTPEIVLIALYVAGYIGHRRGFKYKKHFRWATMIVGLVVLGFMYNQPLTIGIINSFMLGFWPNWRTNIYWYLLLGGIFFVVTAQSKNPYCSWFCPFGACQEVLGAIGGARYMGPKAGRGREVLKWTQRGLALTAIVLALIFRNPGATSYEIFGNLFAFNGAPLQWVVLGIILVLSLFVRRPWCNYLCPLDPTVDIINSSRRWITRGIRSVS
ncbi:MAG: FMN-binding protein [Anaerolineales bacterium]